MLILYRVNMITSLENANYLFKRNLKGPHTALAPGCILCVVAVHMRETKYCHLWHNLKPKGFMAVLN